MKKQMLLLGLLFISMNILAQKTDEPKGKFGGIIFGDYYYNAQRDTGIVNIINSTSSGLQGIHGLQLRRINLSYDYQFSSKFSSRVRLESDETNFTVNSGDKPYKFGVFIKDAYIKWNFISNYSLIIGIQPTPAFEVSESVWGHRFLEKTIMDLRGIVSSRDMAITLKGQADSTGKIKYTLMYGSNTASKPESDKFKRYYGNIELNLVKPLSFSAYADYQTKADILNTYNDDKEVSNDILTIGSFIGYKVKGKYMAGVEAFFNIVNNGYDDHTALKDKTAAGLSVFASYNFSSRWAALGRFDYFEPNSKKDGDRRYWYIAGIAYQPNEKFVLSPNIIIETYEQPGDVEIKSSITPRLSFSMSF